MKEPQLKTMIKTMLKAYAPQVWFFMPIGGPYAAKGTPDLIICANGAFIGCEVKTTGKKPTALQELCHSKIGEASGQCWVIDTEEKVYALENEIRGLLG